MEKGILNIYIADKKDRKAHRKLINPKRIKENIAKN
jgi:hypothetical protein